MKSSPLVELLNSVVDALKRGHKITYVEVSKEEFESMSRDSVPSVFYSAVMDGIPLRLLRDPTKPWGDGWPSE